MFMNKKEKVKDNGGGRAQGLMRISHNKHADPKSIEMSLNHK